MLLTQLITGAYLLMTNVLARAISISTTTGLTTHTSLQKDNTLGMVPAQEGDVSNDSNRVLNKRDARVASKRIIYTYSCPKTGLTTRTFELALYYWPLRDEVDWTAFTHVGGFNHKWESNREPHKPIKATAVWFGDTCPEHQALNDICSYHFEGHVFAEIYAHFIYLDGVGITENPADIRAPVVWESCVDMSRAVHTHTCPVLDPKLKSWTVCTVIDVDIGPLTS